MKYVYPAILTQEDDGIIVSFPDVEGARADGATMEEKHMDTKPPTPIASLDVPKGSTVALVRSDTFAYSKKVDTRDIRKSVSIPAWMDSLARDHNLNFSNVLQNAICRELNIAQ